MQYRNAIEKPNNIFDCEINHPDFGWIPFTCNPLDKGANFDVKKLYETIKQDKKYIAYKEPSNKEKIQQNIFKLRAIRNNVFQSILDPIIINPLRWDELDEDKKEELKKYRQEWLDITTQKEINFENIVLPKPPDWL